MSAGPHYRYWVVFYSYQILVLTQKFKPNMTRKLWDSGSENR